MHVCRKVKDKRAREKGTRLITYTNATGNGDKWTDIKKLLAHFHPLLSPTKPALVLFSICRCFSLFIHHNLST